MRLGEGKTLYWTGVCGVDAVPKFNECILIVEFFFFFFFFLDLIISLFIFSLLFFGVLFLRLPPATPFSNF